MEQQHEIQTNKFPIELKISLCLFIVWDSLGAARFDRKDGRSAISSKPLENSFALISSKPKEEQQSFIFVIKSMHRNWQIDVAFLKCIPFNRTFIGRYWSMGVASQCDVSVQCGRGRDAG